MDGLLVKPGGYRHGASSELVRECPMGTRACVGGNSSGDALCGPGYEGPLCVVCSSGFIQTNSECIACASSRTMSSVVVPIVVILVVISVATLTACSEKLKPSLEYFWHMFGPHLKIVWTCLQILAQIPITLNALLPSSLRRLYLGLSKITDFNPFAAFGLS